jgi:hypothetical protein
VVRKKQTQNKSKTSVQTILLSKEKFFTPEAAEKWLMLNGLNSDLDINAGAYYRARQVDPRKFDPDSFRTIRFSDRVLAVIGVRKDR